MPATVPASLGALDAAFERIALDEGAARHPVPDAIDRGTLERAGFFAAFPQLAVAIGRPGMVANPAVCYHCYAGLADRTLESPATITCVARCAREEPGGYGSPGRLREFTMREIVFVGGAEWVADARGRWMTRVERLAAEMGLRSALEVATDPFFGPAARGRAALQRIKELKYELRLFLGHAGATESVAAASFNLHEDFFGARFGITLPDGRPAHSACVAFGLERWALALGAMKA